MRLWLCRQMSRNGQIAARLDREPSPYPATVHPLGSTRSPASDLAPSRYHPRTAGRKTCNPGWSRRRCPHRVGLVRLDARYFDPPSPLPSIFWSGDSFLPSLTSNSNYNFRKARISPISHVPEITRAPMPKLLRSTVLSSVNRVTAINNAATKVNFVT